MNCLSVPASRLTYMTQNIVHVLSITNTHSMKKWNDRILKEELPRLVGAQYATADQWRTNSRKNGGMDPKQKQYPVVDVIEVRSHAVKSNIA